MGGTFDPPHIGHLHISKQSLKKLKLKKIIWIITKKNPLKKKPLLDKNTRIKLSKKLVSGNKKILVKYYDDIVKSKNTVDLLKYLKKKNKKSKIFLIIGSDNLIHFHKWFAWKKILQMCELVVFSRKNFDKKARKSPIIRSFKNKNIIFIKNQKIDISSTKIREYYKRKYIR